MLFQIGKNLQAKADKVYQARKRRNTRKERRNYFTEHFYTWNCDMHICEYKPVNIVYRSCVTIVQPSQNHATST
jgi:hypothetical protein